MSSIDNLQRSLLMKLARQEEAVKDTKAQLAELEQLARGAAAKTAAK